MGFNIVFNINKLHIKCDHVINFDLFSEALFWSSGYKCSPKKKKIVAWWFTNLNFDFYKLWLNHLFLNDVFLIVYSTVFKVNDKTAVSIHFFSKLVEEMFFDIKGNFFFFS